MSFNEEHLKERRNVLHSSPQKAIYMPSDNTHKSHKHYSKPKKQIIKELCDPFHVNWKTHVN